jgi:hypothetical protein
VSKIKSGHTSRSVNTSVSWIEWLRGPPQQLWKLNSGSPPITLKRVHKHYSKTIRTQSESD